MGQSDMASVAGSPTSASSAIANEPGEKPSPDILRVILAATDFLGEANTASMWFRNGFCRDKRGLVGSADEV